MLRELIEQPIQPGHMDALDAGLRQVNVYIGTGMDKIENTRLIKGDRHINALHAHPVN